MNPEIYPSLYQVNTRVWLTELSASADKTATLDNISDAELEKIADSGFQWIWFLSVWTTGEKGRSISRENEEWHREFEKVLPDLNEEDIGGSGFSIAGYHVSPRLGGDEALARLRLRMKKFNLKMMLDFVPNHLGPDHPWVAEHPEYFVHGSEEDLLKFPQNYAREGNMILAHGRDPFFPGWSDTYQLDYSNPAAVEAMIRELRRISEQCDGVRCDMAMLILPQIFESTWGRRALPFWPAIIKEVHQEHPGFCFMAEVYWDLEWEMQQQGFDYAYDKRLYDRLHEGNTPAVREHFFADLHYQDKLARFLENHDEHRAASAFGPGQHKAAAVITYLSPGMRFFHQGQLEGKKIKVSPHLVRGPSEPADDVVSRFYEDLLTILKKPVLHQKSWKLLQPLPAWEGNDTSGSFIIFSWGPEDDEKILIAVNFSPHQSQCFVPWPFPSINNKLIFLQDLFSQTAYEREADDLLKRGLFLDMLPWEFHVFRILQ